MHTSSTPPAEHLAGILLHPTSLPSRYGIGDLGDELIGFLDWTAGAGMRLWQVLPLHPPGYGNSPYGCLSSFAGNPLLISPQRLLQDDLLEHADVARVPSLPIDEVDFEQVAPYKFELFRKAFARFERHAPSEMQDELAAFIAAPEQQPWLASYAMFMTLKEHAKGQPWWEWPGGLATREAEAMARARAEHAEEIRFWSFLQWIFFEQWAFVREAARTRGIRILGDVPIYVAWDSADVWANPELFQLDEASRPTVVSGVPPDYFSETGQRWGNPLYRWDVMRENGFEWWVARIRTHLRFADLVRLDHFRGFAAYWEIPADEETAINGRWMPGPGVALFEAIRSALGSLPLIAEDLGFITDDVHELRKTIGVPGMKILQFGFGQDDSPHLPHRFEEKTVVYTGTHDNDTARGWFQEAGEDERERALAYLGCSQNDIPWGLIRAAYTSVAALAIIPAQDILRLGSEARMNTPGQEKHNWSWRMRPAALTHADAERLRQLSVICGRS